MIHRVNEVSRLRKLHPSLGAEVDVRANGSRLILQHEPFSDGEDFGDFISEYQHGLLVLNVKEAGIEDEVLRLVRARGISRFFLLDVEFPYIYRASRAGERAIALRYSEEESIESVEAYAGMVDWVWVDTFTRLPLTSGIVERLRPFHTCLVCPERWGRPGDIDNYGQQLQRLGFRPTAVMTSMEQLPSWERWGTGVDSQMDVHSGD